MCIIFMKHNVQELYYYHTFLSKRKKLFCNLCTTYFILAVDIMNNYFKYYTNTFRQSVRLKFSFICRQHYIHLVIFRVDIYYDFFNIYSFIRRIPFCIHKIFTILCCF